MYSFLNEYKSIIIAFITVVKLTVKGIIKQTFKMFIFVYVYKYALLYI